ncbi:MAG: MFS transporter [Chthoniobacterales bacterium]
MSKKASLPLGLLNANFFNLFNAMGVQMIMGAPIILFAKSVGASSTVLGIIASFGPLMAIFQLPAAQYLPRYGYKKFLLMGWSVRTLFIFLIALIPFLGFLGNTWNIAILLGTLFFFNLIRGISSCAWYPWITELIPESVRGRFISRDHFCMHLGCLLAMGASALIMHEKGHAWEYSALFLISAVSSSVGLYFIKKIPDVPANEAVKHSSHKVPWRAMIVYRPFGRLVLFNVLFMLTTGGLSVFTVEYLQEFPKFSPSLIMALSGLSFLAALISMPITGRLIDQLGSKLVLSFSLIVYIFVILGWLLMAGGAIHASMVFVAALNFFGGLAGATFNLANVRIMMSTMPVLGRNHFFALFSVITSLGLGAAPIIWGIALDTVGTYEAGSNLLIWKRHSFYFAAILVFNILTFFIVKFLREGKQITDDANLLAAKLRRIDGGGSGRGF